MEFVFVFLAILSTELLRKLLSRQTQKPSEEEEAGLIQQINQLKRESNQYNTPDTFAKYAKIQRQLTKLNATLASKTSSTRAEVWPSRNLSMLLTYLIPLLFVYVYWDTYFLQFPSWMLWPLDGIIQRVVNLRIGLWALICRQVCSCLLSGFRS
eukprot:GILJ01006340.1.p1 GENE.GILJ01006340.1~~GILJ01006340.1.p1  ORF type:complete len:167 (+),score=15.06 GILJ01006340.1:41-502(+)